MLRTDPIGKLKLEPDEAQLLEDFEGGALQSVATRKELDRLRSAAQAAALKDKRVNIRLSAVDLQAIQARALADGLPYQTLMASVLHKFAAGRLLEAEIASTAPQAKAAAGHQDAGGKRQDLTPKPGPRSPPKPEAPQAARGGGKRQDP